jgi:N6-adenosine-specific RNA methylase IME4
MFRVLVADPGWRFDDTLGWRGAQANYQTMSLTSIMKFELPPLTDDATLFLWRVASMQGEALAVVRAWGFVCKSELVWLKRTKYGRRWFGMGHHVRNEHETCLICTRGQPRTRSHSIRSTFEAPFVRHSEKPEKFYQIVEQLREGPYVEIFARRPRAGWTCLGNEVAA